MVAADDSAARAFNPWPGLEVHTSETPEWLQERVDVPPLLTVVKIGDIVELNLLSEMCLEPKWPLVEHDTY